MFTIEVTERGNRTLGVIGNKVEDKGSIILLVCEDGYEFRLKKQDIISIKLELYEEDEGFSV